MWLVPCLGPFAGHGHVLSCPAVVVLCRGGAWWPKLSFSAPVEEAVPEAALEDTLPACAASLQVSLGSRLCSLWLFCSQGAAATTLSASTTLSLGLPLQQGSLLCWVFWGQPFQPMAQQAVGLVAATPSWHPAPPFPKQMG